MVNPTISLKTAEPTLGHGIVGRSRSTQVRDSVLSFSKIAIVDEKKLIEISGGTQYLLGLFLGQSSRAKSC